jgi:phage major head subunit gpT-like protein
MFIRTSFTDFYLSTQLPAIDAVIFSRFEKKKSKMDKVYHVKDSARSIEQTVTVAGFGTMSQIAEGAPTVYDDPIQGFDKTYQHTQFSLGFRTTKVALDDDRFGLISKLAGELGRSAYETIEVQAANTFNNGFSGSFVGPDNVALFSTAHPLLGGGTQANKPTTDVDLDVPALQQALTTFRGFIDDRRKRIQVTPETLLVPGQLEFAAKEILGGAWKSDTANHTINSFLDRQDDGSFNKFVVWDYLTSSTAWFVLGEKEEIELRWYWRERFSTVHDIDFDSRSIKTAGWMRFSFGWSDYLGLYGSNGP